MSGVPGARARIHLERPTSSLGKCTFCALANMVHAATSEHGKFATQVRCLRVRRNAQPIHAFAKRLLRKVRECKVGIQTCFGSRGEECIFNTIHPGTAAVTGKRRRCLWCRSDGPALAQKQCHAADLALFHGASPLAHGSALSRLDAQAVADLVINNEDAPLRARLCALKGQATDFMQELKRGKRAAVRGAGRVASCVHLWQGARW